MQDNLKILGAIVGLIVFVMTIILLMSFTSSEPTPQSQRSATTAAQPEEPAEPKTWQAVTTLSGNNSKRSDTFYLTGAKARLTYTVTPQDQYGGGLSIYVMESHKTLDKNGGSTEVSSAKTNGETLLYKPAGDYYFDISSFGVDWTATIEEYK